MSASLPSPSFLSPADVESFRRDGIIAVKGFASPEEVHSMKSRMSELISSWEPEQSAGSVFSTDGDKHVNNQYFLGSAATIRFFLEPSAIQDGKVRSDLPKENLINKVGHALHVMDPVFRAFSSSEKVKALVKDLGYESPVLPQSMYIFKQALIGDRVSSHQDSTFLYTTPRQTCLGLWLALDDADEEDGCLWARKGSHSEKVRRRFVRSGEEKEPMKFDILDSESPAMQWEGQMPGGIRGEYSASSLSTLSSHGFESLPVKAGDLCVFPGQLDHLSLMNLTQRPRHTFQLHLVEGEEAGVQWDEGNWLQYPEGGRFMSLKVDA